MEKTRIIPFDIEKAKKGAKVQTVKGDDVRILCYDKKGDFPIVAIVKVNSTSEEIVVDYDEQGRSWAFDGDWFLQIVDEIVIHPIFQVGDVMRTWKEAENGVNDGLPVIASIDDEYYHCNNELIKIENQCEYEFPPKNRQNFLDLSENDYDKINNVIGIFVQQGENVYRKFSDDFRPGWSSHGIIKWLKNIRNRIPRSEIDITQAQKGDYCYVEPGLIFRFDKIDNDYVYGNYMCSNDDDTYEKHYMIGPVKNITYYRATKGEKEFLDWKVDYERRRN